MPPKKAIENKFREVWHPEYFYEEVDWHEKIIGVYHISGIGCGHADIDPDEHSGPCLRQVWWDYTHPIPHNQETEGNFEMGSDLHEKWQKIVKKWRPGSFCGLNALLLFSLQLNIYADGFMRRISCDIPLPQWQLWTH